MGGADAVKQRVACGAVPVPVGLLGVVQQLKEGLTGGTTRPDEGMGDCG